MFSRWSATAKAVAGMAAASSVYTGVIGYNTISHRAGVDPNFGAGSADDMLNDKLQTGDVILFSRRWYNYHLPQAACIKLYQMTHDASYDHLGVVVCKLWHALLVQQTFFGVIEYACLNLESCTTQRIRSAVRCAARGKRPDASAVNDCIYALFPRWGYRGWYDDFSNIMAGSSVTLFALNTLMTFFDKLDLVVGEAGEEGQGKQEEVELQACSVPQVDVREKHPTVGEGSLRISDRVVIRTT